MDQRVSLVTLGVADLERSLGFYRALGWREHSYSQPGEIAFFQANGMVVALWERVKLAADSGVVDGGGWGGITLAHNVRSPAEVDAILAEAVAAGGRLARAADATFWGGYSGIFLDLDGHPWEVAHVPDFVFDSDRNVTLPA